ncbi:hypothetical protein Q7P35_006817 [Cladosporium inversicolor]
MAGLYGYPYGYYTLPPELVDHAHERRHQHNTFMGAISHRKPDPKAYPNHPDVDLSDAVSHYLIDLEVPGTKDANTITLRWTSWRSLIIASTTFRPGDHVNEKTMEQDTDNGGVNDRTAKIGLDVKALKDAQNGGPDKDSAGSLTEDGHLPLYLLIGERRIGTFRREFHFPVDVDMEHLEAKLEAGLLRVKVPKKTHSFPKGSSKIEVQSMD